MTQRGVVIALCALSACAVDMNVDEQGRALERGEFASCLDGALPGGLETESWEHFGNYFVTRGRPWHSAQDVVAVDSGPVDLPGKFSYGRFSKDLEGERIEVWMNDCRGSYERIGIKRTDSDGRIRLRLGKGRTPLAGAYRVIFRVRGDGTTTSSILRVYPPDTQLVVFDIDATLTTSDTELWGQVVADVLEQEYSPIARDGARETTLHRAEAQGYELVYLTARPYLLTELSRRWLAEQGMAQGALRVTDDVGQSWPSSSKAGKYKRDYLNSLTAAGFELAAAYGNSDTDIEAYAAAGIPLERTYILGDRGGDDGTVDLGDDYRPHLQELAVEPEADQPF